MTDSSKDVYLPLSLVASPEDGMPTKGLHRPYELEENEKYNNRTAVLTLKKKH